MKIYTSMLNYSIPIRIKLAVHLKGYFLHIRILKTFLGIRTHSECNLLWNKGSTQSIFSSSYQLKFAKIQNSTRWYHAWSWIWTNTLVLRNKRVVLINSIRWLIKIRGCYIHLVWLSSCHLKLMWRNSLMIRHCHHLLGWSHELVGWWDSRNTMH